MSTEAEDIELSCEGRSFPPHRFALMLSSILMLAFAIPFCIALVMFIVAGAPYDYYGILFTATWPLLLIVHGIGLKRYFCGDKKGVFLLRRLMLLYLAVSALGIGFFAGGIWKSVIESSVLSQHHVLNLALHIPVFIYGLICLVILFSLAVTIKVLLSRKEVRDYFSIEDVISSLFITIIMIVVPLFLGFYRGMMM